MTGRCRALVLVSSVTVLVSGVVAFGAQRSGPKPAPDPALGDGGVSAFYVWDQEVPSTPGTLLRQEPVPDHLVLTNAAKGLRVLYTATNGIDGKTTVAVSGAILFSEGKRTSRGLARCGMGARHHGSRGCMRSVVDATREARHGVSECLARARLCGRCARLPRPGHAWRTSLAVGATRGLERARQRAVRSHGVSGVGECCGHRRGSGRRVVQGIGRSSDSAKPLNQALNHPTRAFEMWLLQPILVPQGDQEKLLVMHSGRALRRLR